MKKYLVAFTVLAFAAQTYAQDVNKLIDAKDVDRIIKTLSADDMQGRATFTPGIEKAAQLESGPVFRKTKNPSEAELRPTKLFLPSPLKFPTATPEFGPP